MLPTVMPQLVANNGLAALRAAIADPHRHDLRAQVKPLQMPVEDVSCTDVAGVHHIPPLLGAS